MKKSFPIFLSVCIALTFSCLSKETKGITNPRVSSLKAKSLLSIYQIEITEEDGFKFRCSGFVFGKFGGEYYMVTAGHCIVNEVGIEKKIRKYPKEIKMVFRDPYAEKLYPADLVAIIYNKNEEDFSVIKVKIDKDINLLKFSNEKPFSGQCVFAVGFPLKASDKIFFSHIEDDSDEDGEIVFMVKGIKDSGGISGSPLFSCSTKEVIGVVVSYEEDNNNKLFAIQIFKLKKFVREIFLK